MSNPDSNPPKQEHKAPALGAPGAEPAGASLGFGAYLVGGGLGLALLFVLWHGLSSPPKPAGAEVSQLVIMAEFEDVTSQKVRADLARLQDQLATLSQVGVGVLGPTSSPILLPSQGPAPRPVALASLSVEEASEALPYLQASKWWTPRIFGKELKSACFRAAPPVGQPFPAGARGRLAEILKEFEGSSLKLWAYSHDLRYQEPEARDKINFEFGVQTANVLGTLPAGKSCLSEPLLLFTLRGALSRVSHPQLRSTVTLADFWVYVLAVSAKVPSFEPTQITEEERARVIQFSKDHGAAGFAGADGQTAFVFVTTSAEDKENPDVAYFVCGNVQGTFTLQPMR